MYLIGARVVNLPRSTVRSLSLWARHLKNSTIVTGVVAGTEVLCRCPPFEVVIPAGKRTQIAIAGELQHAATAFRFKSSGISRMEREPACAEPAAIVALVNLCQHALQATTGVLVPGTRPVSRPLPVKRIPRVCFPSVPPFGLEARATNEGKRQQQRN